MTNVMTLKKPFLTTPLMRQSVGFDRFSDLFDSLMRETGDQFDSYPPYNIERLDDDHYEIVMAVAGFTMDDLSIILENGTLTIQAKSAQNISKDDHDADDEQRIFLHKGIGMRAFEKTFRLADYIQVDGAVLENGLLTIHLSREIPEEKKPRQIPIANNPIANNKAGNLLSKTKKKK